MVLLDGLEVVQKSHRKPLIQALVKAYNQGNVDNIVLTLATDEDEQIDEVEGAKIWRLTKNKTPDHIPDVGKMVGKMIQSKTPEPKGAIPVGFYDDCPF